MKLEVYFGPKRAVKSWESNMRDVFLGLFDETKNPGFRASIVTCREVIYRRINEAHTFKDLTSIPGMLNVDIHLDNGKNLFESGNEFLSRFDLRERFFITKSGVLRTKNAYCDPAVFSALTLIFKKYSKYLSTDDPNEIPLAILDAIISTKQSTYQVDFIFTAFFIFVMLSENFRTGFTKAFMYKRFDGANGPGKFMYYNLYSTTTIANKSGFGTAAAWWKEGDVQKRLEIIFEKNLIANEEQIFVRTLM